MFLRSSLVHCIEIGSDRMRASSSGLPSARFRSIVFALSFIVINTTPVARAQMLQSTHISASQPLIMGIQRTAKFDAEFDEKFISKSRDFHKFPSTNRRRQAF